MIMNTDPKIKNQKWKTMIVVLSISAVSMVSCSKKICSAYAVSEERSQSQQNLNPHRNGAQSILSPYTEKYKAYLQKKYSGRR
jgi:hypothetical protein